MPEMTYLTTEELSMRIKYDSRTIRDRMKDSVLLEGRHYIRPFGGRKTLYIWEHIENDMGKSPRCERGCSSGSGRNCRYIGLLFGDICHLGRTGVLALPPLIVVNDYYR